MKDRAFYPAVFTYEEGREIAVEFPDLGVATSGVDDDDALPELRELPTICVDSAEFVVSKLKDRGTHQAFGVVTNAQDFMHILRLYVEREIESRGAAA